MHPNRSINAGMRERLLTYMHRPEVIRFAAVAALAGISLSASYAIVANWPNNPHLVPNREVMSAYQPTLWMRVRASYLRQRH